MLNNREVVSLIWIGIFLIWIFIKDKRAQILFSFLQVARAFCALPIIVSIFTMLCYIALIVILLHYIGVWQVENLKTTVLWTLTFAFITLLDINRITEDNTFYATTVRETISATALIVFIAELYTFSFWTEFFLVPFLTVTGIMHVMSERDPELAAVHKFLNTLLICTGLWILGYGVYNTIENFDKFVTIDTAKDFGLPILFSILFLPFIYLLSVYMTYEKIFCLLKIRVKDQSLQRYTKFKAFLLFNIDLYALRRWWEAYSQTYSGEQRRG